MNEPVRHAVTDLLRAAREGRADALDDLFALLYEDLHRLAHVVRRGRAGETLNTTALVHEAYERLVPSQDLDWQGRAHFFAVAARAMRQVLARAARERSARKRGGGQAALSFDERLHGDGLHGADAAVEDLITLDEALSRFETVSPRQARVVECRFFAGLTVEETAEALGLSAPTVKRDWRFARAWLTQELAEESRQHGT